MRGYSRCVEEHALGVQGPPARAPNDRIDSLLAHADSRRPERRCQQKRLLFPGPPLLTRQLFRWRREGASAEAERLLIEQVVSRTCDFGPRTIVTAAGTRLEESCFLLEGLMCRYVDGRDGARQLVAIQVPGDFVDLHGYPLKVLDHDVGTITAVRMAMVPHSALEELQQRNPQFTRRLWSLTLIDAAIHRQWVFRLGRLRAIQRVAHFLCETNLRMLAIGASDGREFRLPVTQNDIAEICGLTSVHVSRVLRDLRTAGICSVRNALVQIRDIDQLIDVGEFDPAYLYYDEALIERMARQKDGDRKSSGSIG